MNPYKQVELYKKYAPNIPERYRAITCPKPSKQVLDYEKKEKSTNVEVKADKKVKLQKMKAKIVRASKKQKKLSK